MTAETHPYYSLSLPECIALLFAKDELLTQSGDREYRYRQTIGEYRQLIWGKKSEKHITALASIDMDTCQPELPFTQLPEVKTSVTISTEEVTSEKESKKYLRLVKPSGRKELSQSLPRQYVEILPEN